MDQNIDRTYRFIADPTHKENLSGRVTAACLNCRKRKIKCSGVVDCQQCQERGLTCDGPPSRKRPKRDQASSSSSTAHEATATNAQQLHPPQDPSPARSPSHATLTPRDEDSGYGSHDRPADASRRPSHPAETPSSHNAAHRSIPSASTPVEPYRMTSTQPTTGERPLASADTQLPYTTSPFAFNTNTNTNVNVDVNVDMSRYGSMNDVPPTTGGIADWSFVPHGTRNARGFHVSNTATPEDMHGTHTASTVMPGGMMNWTSRRSSDDWWAVGSGNVQSPTELISAAEALEEQAQSLRRLASRRQSDGSSAMSTQPAILPPQPTIGSDGLDQTTFFDPALRSTQALNASTFFRNDGTLRSGLTPNTNEYATWWDVDGDIQDASQSAEEYVPPQQQTQRPGVGQSPTSRRIGDRAGQSREHRTYPP